MKQELKIFASVGIGLILLGFVLVTIGHCAISDVKANDPNTNGYIFTGTGITQGNTQVGTWVDPSFLQGATGQQGIQGLQGIGTNGKDVDPTTVINLQNTDTLLQNNINIETDNRIIGDNNLQNNINNEVLTRFNEDTKLSNKVIDVNNKQTEWNNRQDKTLQDHENKITDLNNRMEKLEQTQFVLETSFRILDTRRISIRPFLRQNFSRGKIDIVGLKIDIKLGSSYEEKLIKKVNARLDLIEKIIGNSPIIERTINEKGELKSISISNGKLLVNKEF